MMGTAFAVALGAALLSSCGLGFLFGVEAGRRARKRQIAAARDVTMRLITDPRTYPHISDQLERELVPLLTERKR